jgi:hypothetical protein
VTTDDAVEVGLAEKAEEFRKDARSTSRGTEV